MSHLLYREISRAIRGSKVIRASREVACMSVSMMRATSRMKLSHVLHIREISRVIRGNKVIRASREVAWASVRMMRSTPRMHLCHGHLQAHRHMKL